MITWRATHSEPRDDGVILTLQPFDGKKRACPSKHRFRFLVTATSATYIDGSVAIRGIGHVDHTDAGEVALYLYQQIVAPPLQVGHWPEGDRYMLLGPYRSQADNLRFAIPLEGPYAGTPVLAKGTVEVTEWPDRLDKLVNAWLRWYGWDVPHARMRLWVAELPADRSDVPIVAPGVPVALVLQNDRIRLYPASADVRYGDVGAIFPDAVALALAAEAAQATLPALQRACPQVWTTGAGKPTALVWPARNMTVLFPSLADAMEETNNNKLGVPYGRHLKGL